MLAVIPGCGLGSILLSGSRSFEGEGLRGLRVWVGFPRFLLVQKARLGEVTVQIWDYVGVYRKTKKKLYTVHEFPPLQLVEGRILLTIKP